MLTNSYAINIFYRIFYFILFIIFFSRWNNFYHVTYESTCLWVVNKTFTSLTMQIHCYMCLCRYPTFQYSITLTSKWAWSQTQASRLFNRFFKLRSKETSKLRVTDLWEGKPPVTYHKSPVKRKMFPFDGVIIFSCVMGPKALCRIE